MIDTGTAVTAATPADDPAAVPHACALPVSDEHLWELTAGFLGEGLRRGEQVVYGENGTADAVLARLVDDGVALGGPLETGQLTVVPTDAVAGMLAQRPEQIVEATAALIDSGLAAGWPGVRLVSESSAAVGRGDIGAIVAVETGIDRVLADRPAMVRCFYDRNRFSEDAVAALRAVHRHEITLPAPHYDDDLLRITTPRPFVVRLAGEVDHSNRPRIVRALEQALDAVLRATDSPPEVELDLASLRFLDVGGAAALVQAAEGFPRTHTLVLTGVRPGAVRVLDRCGAPFTERLRVRPHHGPYRPLDR